MSPCAGESYPERAMADATRHADPELHDQLESDPVGEVSFTGRARLSRVG